MEGTGETVINTKAKQKDTEDALVIAVSSRALFNMEKEHQLFLEKGKEAYVQYQIANEDNPLPEGTAFAFIKAVQKVNEKLLEQNPEEKMLFDVIMLSNNTPQSGMRIINSAVRYGLDISRFCFVSDEDSTNYLKPNEVKLFLSADKTDVVNSLKKGIAAALVFQQEELMDTTEQLRIVFDGDAVLFSNETELVYQEYGLQRAKEYEKQLKDVPMGEGPLKNFAVHLGKLRKKFGYEGSPLATYLVTARSGWDTGLRIIRTLREWGLEVDEAFFMAGASKGPILSAIQPHIYFDDSLHNIQRAQDVGAPATLEPFEY
ncbi:cytosolic 5'-nucleotidase 1A [Latimeria chalumnae]|uniref:cytosolic 5'-nucleotidase 1A n=1 Tax=Latimeria chalumnae TaxID=7897 RepID=UPI00313CD675